jgi:hypothetical protein
VPGTRLGSYEVAAQIGVGGMGEVYRARDIKLNRDVALKVLPESFLNDPDRLARFQREAHVLASLNHPNIAAIYGVEDVGNVRALVMELVDGPTLAERIAEGAIPIDEALTIAKQIADALAAAHEQGVIHRDLKPANIKLKADGAVKVLDFGLAKAIDPAAATSKEHFHTALQSPTITTPAMTQIGVLLGTAAYMSPEQAKGRPVDKRSDVWAFGCVLYEMLTGQRAFAEDDVSETIAAVLKSEPDWTRLPSDVPRAIRTLIHRCLVKDQRHRVADIAVAKFVIGELSDIGGPRISSSPVIVAPRSRWRRLLAPAAVAAVTGLIVGAASWAMRPASHPPVVAQFSLTLPEAHIFAGSRQSVAISRDGLQMVYAANSRLYHHPFAEREARVIPGSENTSGLWPLNPMFAPDGQSVAFFTPGDSASQTQFVLRRIPIGGGVAAPIGTVDSFGSATWTADALLVADLSGVLKLSPNGEKPERLIQVARDERASAPQMLPGGRAVLLTLAKNYIPNEGWDKAQIVAHSVADGTRKLLIDGGSDARYVPSGHLVYSVGGTLFAARFDVDTLTVTTPSVPVVVGVRRALGRGTPARQLAISDTGTLLYSPGPATPSTAGNGVVLGDGRADPVLLKIPRSEYVHPRVSPDGRTLAVARVNGQESDIWTYQLSGQTEIRRLTFGGNSRYPLWSGDGRRIAFQSAREGDRAIYSQSADGTGVAERLTKPANGEEHRPEAWSRVGARLLFSIVKDAKFSLWVLALDTRKHEAFGKVESAEPLSASLSPDGRWVAYAYSRVPGGNLSPDRGIFVQPFPATGELHQAPKTFLDFHPVWAPDGRGIFYVPGSARSTVLVPVNTRPSMSFETPVELPRGPLPGLLSGDVRGYDVLPDGRFVSLASADGPTAQVHEIRIVLNWFEELNRLVPERR